MKTKLFLVILILVGYTIQAQIVQVYAPPKKIITYKKVEKNRILTDSSSVFDYHSRAYSDIETDTTTVQTPTFEWFEGGNIDYVSSGLLQTNARLLKVNIGVPNKFYIPFYIMAGADKQTSNDPEEDPNKSTNINLLSSNGGYLNFGLNGSHNLKVFSKDDTAKTRLSFVYLLGAKSITGKDATTAERINLLSMVTNAGLMFQTNAWAPDDVNKMGIAWIQAVFTNTFNNDEKIKRIYGNEVKKNFYGYNIEAGIQIDNYINLRMGYYKYLNNEDINKDFKNGIFKLCVDFSIR